MPVRRGRADSGPARRVGEGEPRRPFLCDQVERRVDQRFAQIAVMVAAPFPLRFVRGLPRPSHVKEPYMTLAPIAECKARRRSRLPARGPPYSGLLE